MALESGGSSPLGHPKWIVPLGRQGFATCILVEWVRIPSLSQNILTVTKMKKKKTETEKAVGKLLSIKILCPVLNKEVVITDYSFSASESECETCGSHGHISLFAGSCECGKYHDIEISSW